jgi:hypothetical protein
MEQLKDKLTKEKIEELKKKTSDKFNKTVTKDDRLQGTK